MRQLLFALLLFAVAHLNVGQNDYCFGKDDERPQTRHFSSLTAYEIAKGTNMDKQYLVPDCEAKKAWILHRHGTRLPTKSVIEKVPRLKQLQEDIIKNHEARHSKRTVSSLCEVDYVNIKVWKWNNSITVDQSEYLTSQGYADLRGTASVYKKFYPEIFGKEYDKKQYLFRHTAKQRTTESFKAFAEGLFGANNNAKAEPIPDNDNFLRPLDYCESWKEHNYQGPNSEYYKYKKSELWNRTLESVSARLGFDYTLESEDVELMYDMCRYEQAWKVDRTSTWCAVFRPEHIYTLEFGEDIFYYYRTGYGYEENTRVNCRLVKDMLTRLNSAASPNGIAYFAHSSAIQTFITALGINKDDSALLATNYNDMSNRRWMTSYIDPFAANFVAVKYECNANAAERENVIFFLNQNAVMLDWCRVGLCSWSEVMKRYQNFYDADCDSYYCRSGASMFGASIVTLLFAAIAYLIH